MEVIVSDPTTGALSVLLGGVVVQCVQDIDCPGGAVCSKNPTGWTSAYPNGMCVCYPNNGLAGADCLQPSTATYCFLILGYIIPAIISGLTASIGLFLCIKTATQGRQQCHVNALSVTLVAATLGSSFICLTNSLVAVEALRTRSMVIVNGTKVDALLPVSVSFLLLAFFFITLSALN